MPQAPRLRDRLLRWYYAVKYRAFRRERRADVECRGLIALQIDALAYADLRRAIEGGHCPTIARLAADESYVLRRWFCGLPSATPYCQAGIFHGENAGIPAFRFYNKITRRVITCNAPDGVQYVRDRIRSPGALAGGSSYVNLLDGDAATVAFTVATRERLSVYERLGGTRMGLLILLHPVRMLRMIVQAFLEWLREEWERLVGELTRTTTHAEGIFPFVRILTNVVVRELQTMAILLDVYLGVPVIYSTFMQYDELAHHFGPTSRQALGDMRRTDRRIREILRMVRVAKRFGGREYDVVILSDHGMTPAVSYRVRFGESLGATVQRTLEDETERVRRVPRAATATPPRPSRPLASFDDRSEYADLGAEVVETARRIAPAPILGPALRRVRDWLRQHYGLREIIIAEKYRVDEVHDVVVTYSSCLALVYFADDPRPLELADLARQHRRAALYASLLAHPGIGLLLTRSGSAVHAEGRGGRALVRDGTVEVLEGQNPLDVYGTEAYSLRALEELVLQPEAGDLVLFGAYDGYEIVSFDDQVGAHGSLGGPQVHPFMLAPAHLGIEHATLENARDVHRVVLSRYAVTATRPAQTHAELPDAPFPSPV